MVQGISYFIKLVAEPMEPIHVELLHLVTEQEAVRGQVQTECNAFRDLFVRNTTAMSCSNSQHDRRQQEDVQQQFGGSRVD